MPPARWPGVGTGQLSGILTVPALNLSAPVEEGTDDPELNVAVGHDPQSVWPGSTAPRCSWPTTSATSCT